MGTQLRQLVMQSLMLSILPTMWSSLGDTTTVDHDASVLCTAFLRSRRASMTPPHDQAGPLSPIVRPHCRFPQQSRQRPTAPMWGGAVTGSPDGT